VLTAFTRMVGVDAPLAGFNRTPAVVAEVTKAGGLGVLAATSYSPAELDAVLTWIDEQVDGKPYGVDLLLPAKSVRGDPGDLVRSLRAQIPQTHVDFLDSLMQRYGIPEVQGERGRRGTDDLAAGFDPSWIEPLLDAAFKHRIALIASALGTPPAFLVERAHANGVQVAALVGSAKHAHRQLEAGVDLLVAQGTEAGGHTGTIATMVLTPEIVDIAGEVPVLAAGGIASGRQLAAALALGAAGGWSGSVWLSSFEDMTGSAVKEKYLDADSSATLRSSTRTGKPARQLRSAWHEEWEKAGAPAPLPMPLQLMLVTEYFNRVDAAADAGNAKAKELASFFIGQVVGSFSELRPAYDIARDIIESCEATLQRIAGDVGMSAGARTRSGKRASRHGPTPGVPMPQGDM
jgi:NAD(P)H-dependent flavin oxidoreductase YrpB (nitropropane dioxygenase family)